MRKNDILQFASMPAAGPYRFIDRVYMVITYETDAIAPDLE